MERKINGKINIAFIEFKNKVMEGIKEREPNMTSESTWYKLMEEIYKYPIPQLTPDDFKKRKRIKNVVPLCDRCCALRSNLKQCTRRKKNNSNYCGTHIKGRPHGEISNLPTTVSKTKVNIWLQEIKGIKYYIDSNNNVYNNYDIINNVENPRIIAKYKRQLDQYTIPELFES